MTLADPRLDYYVAITAVGASTAFMTWFLTYLVMEARRQTRTMWEQEAEATRSPLFRALRPLARVFGAVFSRAARRIEPRVDYDPSRSFLLTTRVRLQRKLLAAGNPENLTPDEFLGLMVLSGLAGAGFGAFMGAKFDLPALILACGLLGFFLPSIWLNDHAKRRQLQIQKALPFALDLLTLAVEAGLDFTAALERIIEKLHGSALAFELGVTLREIQLGKSRADALRDLSHRVSVPEMTSVTSALIQADELGAPLAPILRVQSEQLRNSRSQRAEKLAMEAPVKILAPLIAFIFPNTFIIIAGPIVLKYLIPMFSG